MKIMVLIFPTFIFTQEKKRERDPIPQKSTKLKILPGPLIPNTTRARENKN
jgi:hypothetical protein